MPDRLFRPKTIYLVRCQGGDREDFWPRSAHWTWSGAIQGLKDAADQYEVGDYTNVLFPKSPTDPSAESFVLGDFFIQQMEVN